MKTINKLLLNYIVTHIVIEPFRGVINNYMIYNFPPVINLGKCLQQKQQCIHKPEVGDTEEVLEVKTRWISLYITKT